MTDHEHHAGDDHEHAHDEGGTLPGAVRSALGVLVDGLDKAMQMAGPAGEKARQMSERVKEESADLLGKVKDESADAFSKMREEGAHLADKLRSEDGRPRIPMPDRDEMLERARQGLDIAKTVGAAVLVATVKVVQTAMHEWQAHTGKASAPEDYPPSAAGADSPAWDDAADAAAEPEAERNNWDDVEREMAADPTAAATDAEPAAGAALRAESPPAHHGHHAHDHDAPPLEGFDEMTIGSLRGRLGALTLTDLHALRDYERAHGQRPQVLTMLENRIAKVTAHGDS